MIFLTLGTHPLQFNRLLKRVDTLIAQRIITDSLFAQVGNSDYKPLNYDFQEFLATQEFERYLKMSNLIITHGGAGTIYQCLLLQKKVIAVPRSMRFGEHVDDHQIEIVEELYNKGHILAASIESLPDVLHSALDFIPSVYEQATETVENLILQFIRAN